MNNKFHIIVLVFIFSFLSVGQLIGASLDKDSIDKIKRLPKAQQAALLKRYGSELEGIIGPTESALVEDRRVLGMPAEPLVPIGEEPFDESFVEPLMVEDEKDSEEFELRRFGSDFFDDDISTFAPVDNAPVPQGYVIGVGDTMNLSVFGKQPDERVLQVDREGSVILPNLGAVYVGGMTFEQAKTTIEKQIQSQMIGADVSISMGRIKSINVFMAGEVSRPGSYSVSGLTTLTQGLYLSGGISELGSFRNIELLRDGELIQKYDLYKLLLEGDTSGDQRLRSGDVVFVNTSGPKVSIEGEIIRPAIYEVDSNETLSDLVSMAGNLSSRAFLKGATLQRYDKNSGQPIILNVNIGEPKNLEIKLRDGDAFFIPSVTETLSNPVEITGAAVRPGLYAWEAGSTFTDYISSFEQDLAINIDPNIALIVRKKNTRLDIEIVSFDLVAAINEPKGRADPLIKNYDRILLFPLPQSDTNEALATSDAEEGKQDEELLRVLERLSEDELEESEDEELDGIAQRQELLEPIMDKLKTQARIGEPAQIVRIEGAVRIPGEYPLTGDGDLGLLLALAGGIQDGAYLREVEVRRIIVDEGNRAVTKFVGLDLTNTDVLEKFQLKSQDWIRINYLPDWDPNDEVKISGEVVFPGTYSVSKRETLSSVLARAGGFTENAYPEGLKYISQVTREEGEERARALVRRFARERASRLSVGVEKGDTGIADFESAVLDSFSGRIVIDIPKLMAGDKQADIFVKNGDTIEVPSYVESISVVGEVYEPGTFRYFKNREISDYVGFAAGFTDRARKNATYVIKPNGSVLAIQPRRERLFSFGSNKTNELKPGSVIVVPTNYNYQPLLDRYSSISSVAFESIASIAAFLSIRDN